MVNAINMSRGDDPLCASCSDDGTAKVWDLRMRQSVETFDSGFPVTAVSFSADDELIFTGGTDNVIKAWDRRKESIVFTLEGHMGTSTGAGALYAACTVIARALSFLYYTARTCLLCCQTPSRA